MDLKGMLNDGGAAAAAAGAPTAPGKPPPRPVSQHHQQHRLPSTPIQTVPPHSFHDHPHAVQPSPVRAMSHDYHHPAAAHHHTPFASPSTYGPAASTPYAAPGRPPQPVLQTMPGNHARSPSVGSAHVPASPYSRATPGGGPHRADSAGYPFPSPGGHPHPEYASPVQAHRYPPSGPYPPHQRDSYSQPSGLMASPGPAGHPPPGYFPPQHGPPVGIPVGAHPNSLAQQHQRSASAQSSHAYPQQPPYASPIATNHPPPPSEHGRQPSQPATPLGPPMSTQPRQQSSGQPTFAQPQSPYQHRVSSSTGAPYPPYPPQQPSPHVAPRPQPSPRPPIQRPSSVYEQAVDSQRRSLSHSERERSVSVSPKTRVPSLPSSVGHVSQASFSGPSGPPAELDPRDPRHSQSHSVQMRDAPIKTEQQSIAVKAERASTPAKRKLDDRDIKPEELDRQEPRPPPFETNGSQRPGSSSRPPAAAHQSSSPMLPRCKPRHTAPPIWATPYDRQQLKNANFYLRKPGVNHTQQVNGKTESPAAAAPPRQERPPESRHVSPEASRANPQAPPPNPVAPPVAPAPEKPRMLGPWEATIANQAPLDEMCKTVADFLFMTVVNHAELNEMHGRFGVQFEIEAKLGALIDRSKSGNTRFRLPIESEAVLAPSISDFANFSSSMTEVCCCCRRRLRMV